MAKAAKRKIRAASVSKKRATKSKKKKTAAKARTTKARTTKASAKKTPAKASRKTAGGKRPAARRPLATRRGRGRGDTAKDMPGGYRTCGGTCPDPTPRTDPGDPMGSQKVWCNPTCSGDVASGCNCRLYSYPTPKPGDDPPPM